MGRIFHWDDIPNKVPRADAFLIAKHYLQSRLNTCFTSKEILGGALLGSIVQGTATIRSDIDCIIVTARPEDITSIRGMLNHFEDRYHIPLDANVLVHDDVLKGRHTIDRAFFQYIRSELGSRTLEPYELALQDMFGSFVPSQENLEETLRLYLANKKRRLARAIVTPTDASACTDLQRALEFPVKVMRKIRSIQEIHKDELKEPIPKGEIIECLVEYVHDADVEKSIRWLALKDRTYNDTLALFINGEIDRETYAFRIKSLRDTACVNAYLLAYAIESVGIVY